MDIDELLHGVRERLEAAIKAANTTQKAIAIKAGLGETSVRDILKGYSRDIQIGTLTKIADALAVPLASLLPFNDPAAPRRPTLFVKGFVAAGVWREAFEWPADEWEAFTGIEHGPGDIQHRFGLRIEGDSMDLIYPHGSTIECLSILSGVQIKSGARVVVVRQRRNFDVEATVKEYHVDKDGKRWLIPRSSNPAFQSPISLEVPDPDITEIAIVAVVVASIRRE